MGGRKIFVGVLTDVIRALDDMDAIGSVVTYPADEFPFCVSYTFIERDGTRHDFDNMPCDRWIHSEEEWRAYAQEYFGPGNWEIRDMSGEA